jgi:tRNA-dihydrouridine synthase B
VLRIPVGGGPRERPPPTRDGAALSIAPPRAPGMFGRVSRPSCLTGLRGEGYTPAMTIQGLTVDPPFVLAPLAGFTDSPMRRLCRRMGASLVWTEMVSAEGAVRGSGKTFDLLEFTDEERPIAFQLFGARPEAMRDAAAILARLAPDIVDINVGCPARKIVRSGAGAALMRDLVLLREIALAVVEGADLPVTAKIRSGWDDGLLNAPETAGVLEEAGVAAVTVHPRTRSQGFSGGADWSVIRRVKDEVGVFVIGSGDVRSADDALRMLDETRCDAVMIGRSAVGNPWLFSQARELREHGRVSTSPSFSERIRTCVEHLEMMVDAKGERRGVLEMRKHIVAYLKGMPGASRLRSELVRIDSYHELHARLESSTEDTAPSAPQDG